MGRIVGSVEGIVSSAVMHRYCMQYRATGRVELAASGDMTLSCMLNSASCLFVCVVPRGASRIRLLMSAVGVLSRSD
jgi:hypothetical protein